MPTLITGVTGQDGSLLAELLTGQGGHVTGLIHPGEALPAYLEPLAARGHLALVPCDLSEPAALRHVLRELRPSVVFHLAAMSQPIQSEREPQLTHQVNVVSCEVLLEWQRRDNPAARTLVASSATIFGNSADGPQSELTPVNPEGEYARQKQAVRELATAARGDGLFAACAIPFNHESERRPENFVFTKVCNGAARIAQGRQSQLRVGSLTPRRDWGYAPEYVQAMQWMLEVDKPLELVIGTGESHSIEELARAACAAAGIDYESCVSVGGQLEHPQTGPVELLADPELAWKELGWRAQVRFHELVERLVKHARNQLSE